MAVKRSPIAEYFSNVWSGVVTTYKGMALTLSYMVKKPVTMVYPEERPVLPESHRGQHGFDEEACALCGACMLACPVDCITVQGLGKGKETLILDAHVDYSKCLFCNLCCEACKSDCLFLGKEYDLASAEKEGCVFVMMRDKSPEEIAKFQELLAKKEAEKKAKAEAAAKAKAAAAAAKAAEPKPENLGPENPKPESPKSEEPKQ